MRALELQLELVPEDVRARVLLAGNYAYFKREPEAVRELQIAPALRSNDSNILYNAACAYGLLGNKNEALAVLKKAREAGYSTLITWAATLIYQASLQSDKLEGQAYLEMWVRVPGKGEFFSRGLSRPVTGTMSWLQASTPFFLQTGQKPDLIRLNLVVNGKGRVWIDDIRLLRQPLPSR